MKDCSEQGWDSEGVPTQLVVVALHLKAHCWHNEGKKTCFCIYTTTKYFKLVWMIHR